MSHIIHVFRRRMRTYKKENALKRRRDAEYSHTRNGNQSGATRGPGKQPELEEARKDS